MSQKDFQREKFYNWHHAKFRNVSKIELTPEECTTLVEDACRCYGVKTPTMTYPDGYQAQTSYYRPLHCEIVLYKWARRRYIVLHELAHHIHYVKKCSGATHGEEFFSIYAYLLNQYNKYPLHEIFFKAEQYGVKYAKNFPQFIEGIQPNSALVKPYS